MVWVWVDRRQYNTGSAHPANNIYVPPHVQDTVPMPLGYPPFPDSFSNSAHSYSRFDDQVNSQPTRVGRGRRARRRKTNPNSNSNSNPNPNPNPNSNLKPNPNNHGDGQNDEAVLNFDSYESVPVEVSGSDVPEPVNRFEDIGLVDSVRENIRICRYLKPTPIQKHAIPIALSGRDLMACAQTGSGKTAAFCLPMIEGVLSSNAENGNRVGSRRSPCALPVGLVIAPTRELSCQIYEEATKFAGRTGAKVGVVYGGAPFHEQVRRLAKGVDILVATPGRLIDMIERGKVSLGMIKYLTLDEADRMLDMGFEPQIREIVEQMGMPPTKARQTMLFSATFPDDIQRLASDFLTNYIFLSVGRVGSSTDLIAQKVEYVENMDKRSLLMDILQTQMKNRCSEKILTLVFVETKRGADALVKWLSNNGLPAIAIHGDKVQIEREKALKCFKTGAIPTLVATDVASRGLDIPHVAHVVNFDLPRVIDDYVHRIGRTGRAGKSGLATAFFNEQNIPLAKALVDLMQETKQEVPDWLLQYGEQSSNLSSGVSGRYKSSKFGGRDIRRGQKYDSFVASSGDYHAPTGAEDYGSASANTYDPASYGGDAAGNGYSYMEKQESGVADDWDWN